jgi:hypothetical protein
MARHSAVDKSILEAALIGLEQQKSEIEAKTAEIRRRLRGLGSTASVKAEPAAPAARAKRVLSPAARKRIADATRKRWAAYRAAKEGKAAPKKPGRKKGSAKKAAAAEATAGE